MFRNQFGGARSRAALTALVAVVALVGSAGYLLAHVLAADEPPERGYRMTPYAEFSGPDEYVQGASLDLAAVADPGRLPDLLRDMKERHHINTVTAYGLEHWSWKDQLFADLARLGMKIVIRIEGYDTDRFAFQPADLDPVLTRYEPLIRYVAAPPRRDRVAYLALNMPVDDPGVQDRLGGINSALSRQRQAEYATAFVARIRGVLPGAKVYLGVFYGWDNSYDLPPYAAAGADGYLLTNYSYPAGDVADETADDATLINEPRLRIAIDRFFAQYGAGSPVVVEYGFHTVEYQRGASGGHSAGLVRTASAKRRALAATTRLYRNGYPGVRGTMYFGYNVYKAEGDPPAILDFGLVVSEPA